MATYYSLIVIALEILHCTHNALRTDRGAKNSKGPKLPDFSWLKRGLIYLFTKLKFVLTGLRGLVV